MKRERWEAGAQRRAGSSRRRSRRGWREFLLAPPQESAGNYPGFFTLPRAGGHGQAGAARKSGWRGWLAEMKLTAAVLLGLALFIGSLAFFFRHVGLELSEPEREASTFVFDPKTTFTNSNAGRGRP